MKYVDRLQAADGWMEVGGAKEQVVGCQTVCLTNQTQAAPEMISMSSRVITAWRVLLNCSVSLSIISPENKIFWSKK